MTPVKRAREVLDGKTSDYKACKRCLMYHVTSFLDPPSYHEPDVESTCEMCENAHLEHAFADAIQAAIDEERIRVLQEVNQVFCDGYSSSLDLGFMRDMCLRRGG